MIEKMIWVAGIFLLSGVFWYCIFYQKEKRLLNRLQQMLDHAIDGELERTEISEEKYSALENSMKHYLDSSLGQFTRNYTQTTKRGLLTTNKG